MRERIGIITGWTLIIMVFCVFISYAVPPTPPTVNISGNAATATALASNPTDCGANAVATAIDASGNLTCGYALNADIQAYDADLDTWSGITPSTDVQAFLGAANDTAARTELGLGTIATQAADSVNIDGGAIDGTAIGANSASTGAFTTLSASGQIKGVPSATAPIMFGNTTAVNTTTDGTFPTADKTQIDKTGAFTNAAVGDLILITGGTGATTGQYRLTTKTSNDSVKVDRNIHASGTDITNGAFSVYKDVVTVGVTDGTNGQMISSFSHQNKPLQLGGSSPITASASTTGKDVIMGGNLYFGTGLSGLSFIYNALYIRGGSSGLVLAVNNGAAQWQTVSGADYSLIPCNNNVLDIGSNANRIRTGYFGTSVVTPDAYLSTPMVTAGSGTGVTVNSTGNVIQQVYKVTTTYAAYTDTDLTKGIVIATLPAKTRLVAAYADTTQAYAGTDITAVTLEVGVTAEGAAEILATGNVFAGAILLGDADAEMGTAMTRAAKEQGAYMPSFTGTTAIYATIDATTSSSTTLANLTQGSTTFYLITERLP